MLEVKEFISWQGHLHQGKVALAIRGDHFTLRMQESKLPIGGLLPTIQFALKAKMPHWQLRAEELHRSRSESWRVDKVESQYETRYYMCDSFGSDDVLRVFPFGEISEDIQMWLGNLPPLLAAALCDYHPVKLMFETLINEENSLPKSFNAPGSDSGLQATINGLKAMEVLAR